MGEVTQGASSWWGNVPRTSGIESGLKDVRSNSIIISNLYVQIKFLPLLEWRNRHKFFIQLLVQLLIQKLGFWIGPRETNWP